MTKSKQIVCLILGVLLISAAILPVSADIAITTETKVFFEKDKEPYTNPVEYTVKCYGYNTLDWSGDTERKEPGTYEPTEVFSYTAFVSGYGAKIYEPFYLNYRVIDYCTLCGEAEGKTFFIENTGNTPVPDCSYRKHQIDYNLLEKGSDICYLSTDESDKCYMDESEFKGNQSDICLEYLEQYNSSKIYPKEAYGVHIDGVQMMKTEEYIKCRDKVREINFNCSNYYKEVSCSDYCTPEGYPVERDCSLYFTIPTDKAESIIEAAENPGADEEDNKNITGLLKTDATTKNSDSKNVIFPLPAIINKFLELF